MFHYVKRCWVSFLHSEISAKIGNDYGVYRGGSALRKFAKFLIRLQIAKHVPVGEGREDLRCLAHYENFKTLQSFLTFIYTVSACF
tara:strand:- start:177 stop:434 length:258 start_codon:yes stop_codon:yes gene_type:complete